MSVTFNRSQLVKVTKLALDEHAKAQAAYAKACDDYRAKHAAEYDNTDAVRRLRDYCTSALRKGGPITAPPRDMLGRSSSDPWYSAPGDRQVEREVTAPKGLMTSAEAIEARALLKVLESAVGEEVSVNELKLLGLKNLQPVFTAAANERA